MAEAGVEVGGEEEGVVRVGVDVGEGVGGDGFEARGEVWGGGWCGGAVCFH